MLKAISKIIIVSAICTNLSGCITYALIRHATGGGTEYTASQISDMSSYGLIQCKKAFLVSQKSKGDCLIEINKRLEQGKMTPSEYSAYEAGVSQQQANAWQQMQQTQQQQQALDQQQTQQQMDALKVQQPIDVNVHHTY